MKEYFERTISIIQQERQFGICVLLSPQKRKVHVAARPAVRHAPGACADLHDHGRRGAGAVTPAGIWVTTLTPVGLILLNASRPVHLPLLSLLPNPAGLCHPRLFGGCNSTLRANVGRRRSNFFSMQVIQVRAVCGYTSRLA